MARHRAHLAHSAYPDVFTCPLLWLSCRDLNELDIVGRIMRKDNYLIALINRGVVSPRLPLPRMLGMGCGRALLTKTMEWNLRWCVLDHMLDERTFRLRPDFLNCPERLQTREEEGEGDRTDPTREEDGEGDRTDPTREQEG